MNVVRYGGSFIAGVGVVIAYLIGPPWRHLILTGMIMALIVSVTWLQTRIKRVEQAVYDHDVKLGAIEVVAQRAQVVSDARKIVEEALTQSIREGDTLEDVS